MTFVKDQTYINLIPKILGYIMYKMFYYRLYMIYS